MNKDVIISVSGNKNSSPDSGMELITEGKLYREGSDYYITYDETEVTGMKGTTTLVKVSEGTVTLVRTGAVNTHLYFEKGCKHVTYYDTEFGSHSLGITAKDINIDIGDNGGSIKVDYFVEIDNKDTARSDFCMWIREAGKTIGRYNSNH